MSSPEARYTGGDLLAQTLDAFHRLHEQLYGYVIGGETIELIRFNVEATGAAAPT